MIKGFVFCLILFLLTFFSCQKRNLTTSNNKSEVKSNQLEQQKMAFSSLMLGYCPFLKNKNLNILVNEYISLFESLEHGEEKCRQLMMQTTSLLTQLTRDMTNARSAIKQAELASEVFQSEVQRHILLGSSASTIATWESAYFDAYLYERELKKDYKVQKNSIKRDAALDIISHSNQILAALSAHPDCFDNNKAGSVANMAIGLSGLAFLPTTGAFGIPIIKGLQESAINLTNMYLARFNNVRKARKNLLANINFDSLMCSYMNLHKLRCSEKERKEFQVKAAREKIFKEIEGLDTPDKEFTAFFKLTDHNDRILNLVSEIAGVINSNKHDLLVDLQKIAGAKSSWDRLLPRPRDKLAITSESTLDKNKEEAQATMQNITWTEDDQKKKNFYSWTIGIKHSDAPEYEKYMSTFCKKTTEFFGASIYNSLHESCRLSRIGNNLKASLWVLRQIMIQTNLDQAEKQKELQDAKSFDDVWSRVQAENTNVTGYLSREFKFNELLDYYMSKVDYYDQKVTANKYRTHKVKSILEAIKKFSTLSTRSSVDIDEITKAGNEMYNTIAYISDPGTGATVNESIIATLFRSYLNEIENFYAFHPEQDLRNRFRSFTLKYEIEANLWNDWGRVGGEGTKDSVDINELIRSFDIAFREGINSQIKRYGSRAKSKPEEYLPYLQHACLVFRNMESKYVPRTCKKYIPEILPLIQGQEKGSLQVQEDACWYVQDYYREAYGQQIRNILDLSEQRPFH